uniref:RHS repeat-associated core domain-containing protein n=1 Tax=Kosakonia cowanii TaxID=208223 RepID=UPI003F52ABD1
MREPAHSEAIILARNKRGDLVREENHSGVYQHEYDALSNLSATTFPDGRELKFLRYGTGHLLEMQLSLSGKTLPVTGYQRDRLHRETHRTMGALELETHYDMAGRITHLRCTDNLRDRLVSERRYQWDRADQIIRRMYTDGAPSTPAEKYRQSLWGYDAAGRMTQSLQPEGEERFWYDAADNRTTPELQPVWNNLLKRLDGVSREYDGFGRMTVRHDTHRRVTQRFSYDDEHRISRVEIDGDAEFTKAEYRYDALGRRTEKQVWRRHARKPERMQYAWSGLQMVGETSDSHPDAAVQYIHTENSYEPLARVDSHGEHADIFWYHTELNGLPDSVTDSNGETVWRGASSAWGRSLRESTPVNWDTPQNLRFQGQYLDRETGLHYNTFRYYDPAGGCYTQMDPIGLAGGLNTYTYVVDPLGWVDPWGLAGCSLPKKINLTHEGVHHVKQRHVGNKSGWDHKSKWTISNAEWKSTVRDVFRKPDRITRDGSRFVYEKTLSRTVGQTPEGEALTKVRVVVEANGDLVTAFPQSVFRDAKIDDLIF